MKFKIIQISSFCMLLLFVVPGNALRAHSKITSSFRIPSARQLRPGLNREILNVDRATPSILLNRPGQIRGTSGLVNWEVIVARAPSSFQGVEDSLTWEFAGAPMGDTDVNEILIDPRNDAVRYVRTGNGLYVTRSSGELWTLAIEGNIGAIAIDPTNGNIVYASEGSNLDVSDDQGLTWHHFAAFPDLIPGTPQDAPTFIDSILASSSEGTIVVGLSATFHSARIYTTEDWGDTWTVSFESPSGLHIWDLAEIPSNGYWFFCTEDSTHNVNPVVMRSTDRGLTWQEMLPLTGYLTSGHGLKLAVHPITEIVYFLSEATVLRWSSDFGDSWSHNYEGVGFGNYLLLDNNCFNRVFGGEMVRGLSVGGVFISDDGAQSFSFEGLAGYTVSSLALTNDSRRIFATAYGSGIWASNIGGSISCSQDVLLFADGFEQGGLSLWTSTGKTHQ